MRYLLSINITDSHGMQGYDTLSSVKADSVEQALETVYLHATDKSARVEVYEFPEIIGTYTVEKRYETKTVITQEDY